MMADVYRIAIISESEARKSPVRHGIAGEAALRSLTPERLCARLGAAAFAYAVVANGLDEVEEAGGVVFTFKSQ
jgi:hypothetical protein